MFNYKWTFKDYPEPTNLKVFGTFICGGGSSMGYKLAGFNHLGGIEIDPEMAKIYKANHNPKYLYLEDIRTFNKRDDIPDELYDLDILDGSPPCSSFSTAGIRATAWNKEKKFREGQAKQKLDDLFFHYIELAEKLKPKVVIAENVLGIVMGNAKAYVRCIADAFNKAGYDMQLFLLNASTMGVPQKRVRIFFIGRRKDLKFAKLKLSFNKKPIVFSEYKEKNGISSKNFTSHCFNIWKNRRMTDKCFGAINKRLKGKKNYFSIKFIHENETSPTILSSVCPVLYSEPRYMSTKELIQTGSFPLDYNFCGQQACYIVGMSVPPVMMANIAYQIRKQWFK